MAVTTIGRVTPPSSEYGGDAKGRVCEYGGGAMNRASQIAQLVKNPSAIQVTPVWILSGKIPWKRERLPTPVFWPGEFHGLYSPWGHKESDTTEWLSLSREKLELSVWFKLVSWGEDPSRVRTQTSEEGAAMASAVSSREVQGGWY